MDPLIDVSFFHSTKLRKTTFENGTLENYSRKSTEWTLACDVLTLDTPRPTDSKNNLLIVPSGKDKALTTPLGGK